MNTYETSATVEDQGRVHVVGVPFAPGTVVEVTIRASRNGGRAAEVKVSDRAARLFAALDKAQNTEPVGTLCREELYDRQVVR